mgnify:CR=1 FL=1
MDVTFYSQKCDVTRANPNAKKPKIQLAQRLRIWTTDVKDMGNLQVNNAHLALVDLYLSRSIDKLKLKLSH